MLQFLAPLHHTYTVKIIRAKTHFKDGRRTCSIFNSAQSSRWRHPGKAALATSQKRGTHHLRYAPQGGCNTFRLFVLQCQAPRCMTGKTRWKSFPHGRHHLNKCERSMVVAGSPAVTYMCECLRRKRTAPFPTDPPTRTVHSPLFFLKTRRRLELCMSR